jgi:hypothetical protein
MKVNYVESKTKLTNALQFWLKKDSFETIYDLLLEKHYYPELPVQKHFLNLVVAFETYHHNYIYQCKTSKQKERIDMIEEIKEMIKVNKGLHGWFSRSSKSWREPSLKERLEDMESRINELSEGIFNFSSKVLIQNIVKTRNDIAHTGNYKKRFEIIEIILVSRVLEYLLRIEVYERNFGFTIQAEKTNMIASANNLIKNLAKINGYKRSI